jgi:hypothetical protein
LHLCNCHHVLLMLRLGHLDSCLFLGAHFADERRAYSLVSRFLIQVEISTSDISPAPSRFHVCQSSCSVARRAAPLRARNASVAVIDVRLLPSTKAWPVARP